MWLILFAIFIWIYGALIYWIRELIMYLGFWQNDDGTGFLIVALGIMCFLWIGKVVIENR